MSRYLRLSFWMGLSIVACSCAGCVARTQDGNASVYKMELWLPLLILAGGAVAVIGGIFLAKEKNKIGGIAAMIIGPIAALLFAVPMFYQETRVDKDHFEAEYGFFWSPTKHNIRFDDLTAMRVVEKVSTGRRGRKNYSYDMICVKKDGTQEVVHLGDTLKEAAVEIMENAEAREVAVSVQEANR